MRPFEARDLGARLGLFLAPLALAVLLMLTDLVEVTPARALIAAAVGTVALVLALAAPWSRLPAQAQITPPLLALVTVTLLIAGDSTPGASPLLVLAVGPVLWLALYHEPAQVWAGVAGAGLTAAAGSALAGQDTGTAVATAALMISACACMAVVILRLLGAERDAAQVVKEARDEHRLVLDHLPDTVILVIDRDLRCVSAEGGGLRFDPAELIGREVEDLRDVYEDALGGTEGRRTHERDGRVHDVEVLPLRRDGVIVGALGVARDITEERAAAARLAASERDHRLLTESARDMISRLDPDGTFLYVSAACRELLGHEPEALVGRPEAEVVAPEDRALLARTRARLMALGSATSELRMLHRDGSVVWVEQRLRLVGDEVHSTARDVTTRREAERQLAHLATHDDLTGLWNRRRFNEALREERARAHRRGPDTVMLLLDLDGFKEVNDTHGHETGDRLLAAVADVVRARMRAGDAAARLGGDEFGVLLRGTAPDQAERLAHAYGDAITEAAVEAAAGTVSAHASVGWAVITADALDERAILAVADAAMYRQKALRRQAR